MAEENTIESIDIDAAPSVILLPELDIGSEIIVESESKQDKDVVTGVLADTDSEKSSTDKNDRDIESGIGSLKLGEQKTKQDDINTKSGGVIAFSDADDANTLFELEKQDTEGDTLLHIAVICLFDKIACKLVQVLEELLGNLDIQNSLHQTALHLAVITRQESIVRELLSARASPAVRDYELQTPMHIACKQGNYAMLETILQHCDWNDVTSANAHPLNLPNAEGERCLHLAVKHDDIPMAKLLVSHGADVNLPHRKNGRTPLHVSAEMGLVKMSQFLISLPEIDVNQRTFNDETAAEIAHMREKFEVVELLKPLSFPMMKRRSKPESLPCAN